LKGSGKEGRNLLAFHVSGNALGPEPHKNKKSIGKGTAWEGKETEKSRETGGKMKGNPKPKKKISSPYAGRKGRKGLNAEGVTIRKRG